MSRTAARHTGAEEVAGVRLSHPDRVIYPDSGLTKRDIARYYERIEAWILRLPANRQASRDVAKTCSERAKRGRAGTRARCQRAVRRAGACLKPAPSSHDRAPNVNWR